MSGIFPMYFIESLRNNHLMQSVVSQQNIMGGFYKAHQPWLYAWLRKKVSCAHTAADLTQDAFVGVLFRQDTQAQHLQTIVEPRAYLTTVAQRVLFNHYRRCSLEQAYLDALYDLPQSAVISAEQRHILLETLQQLDALLQTLPAKVRQTFLLSQLEGMRYSEIAAQLTISERTVKRYMAEAFAACLLLID